MEKPFHHLVRGILLQDGKVLLAKAKGNRNSFLPGGHIEFRESAKDALSREMAEELGIACEVSNFIGIVEHKWEKKGAVNCEVNQLFEVTTNELNCVLNPKSKETHIEFFWCHIDCIEESSLQPYPLKKIIRSYWTNRNMTFWESTLHEEIDEFNRN
ncbi:NUDIX domain-containing protein [Heyndrickxia camelliae]|uniref:NUDIX hydrolase n=1 Tax=Heyndrickxia camelliae TaxID=1707093 RepID=A0A2N3LGN9_9BACI|nr:NUDIX domain-containing protein [Heyndrickxia camelliae]PKR83725.1 NUDIX hydrolase [Heyndrickxia camelliae]